MAHMRSLGLIRFSETTSESRYPFPAAAHLPRNCGRLLIASIVAASTPGSLSPPRAPSAISSVSEEERSQASGHESVVVASVTGLWALFREIWIERPRIDVTIEEAWLVPVKGQDRPLIVKGEAILQRMGVPETARRPILTLEFVTVAGATQASIP
jgi:hypothetical protein